MAELTQRAEGNTLSILGKLYAHRLAFKEKVTSLAFVSNASFTVRTKAKPDADVQLDECALRDLCEEALGKVAAALQQEHHLATPPICDQAIVLRTSDLSLKDHSTHALGKLTRHLAETFGDRPYPVSHAFKALIDELRRRNNFEGDLITIQDLRKRKELDALSFRHC